MWKLLIVEDEPGIYHLIHNSIDYDALDIELVGYAGDGQAALELIETHRPDLVITDIAMPVMPGLKLIEEARRRGFATRFVIISGYAQFDYAQTAIKLGVEDYLIKPISRQELNHVLARSIDRMKQEQGYASDSSTRIQDTYRRKKLRASFLMNLVYDQSPSVTAALEELNRDYFFTFRAGVFSLSVLQIDFAPETPLGMQNYTTEHIATLIREPVAADCQDAELFPHHNRLFVLLNYLPDCRARVLRSLQYALDAALDFLTDCPGAAATLAAGIPVSGPEALPVSLQSALQMLDARILLGRGRVLRAEEAAPSSGAAVRFSASRTLIADVEAAADCKDADRLEALFSQGFQSVLDASAAYPAHVLTNAKDLLFVLLTILKQKACYSDEPAALYLRFCDELALCAAPEDLTRRLPAALASYLRGCCGGTDAESSKVMQIALDYMRGNYAKNLRLEDVAEQVFLAPAYFGILFKKETGENFSAYLTRLRLDRAKELLRDVRMNVSQIAYQVGYANKRYFSRVFKENVGVTPNEYRKIHAKSAY